MTLWLVGMMATGKTSAGRMAAESLEVPFLDTDDVVVAESGMSIPLLWDAEGETGFRIRERQAVEQVAGEPAVVATGGGVVLSGENRETMRATGTVVWLDASVETLAGRVGDPGTRPLLGDEPLASLRRLAEERRPLYATSAHHRIDTEGLTVADVARLIGALWPS